MRDESGQGRGHIVEDVEIGVQRVSSGHDRAIVGDLDGIVERVQVDAVHDERHLGGFLLTALLPQVVVVAVAVAVIVTVVVTGGAG